jgi:hypothetical protein
MLDGLLSTVVEHLDSHSDSMDMHEVHCHTDLLKVETLPDSAREVVVNRVSRSRVHVCGGSI